MKEDIKNIPASIRARLQNIARETYRPFAEVLQYYAMERFLYRFSKSHYAGEFILKGALMFAVWNIPRRRTTLDIDFSARLYNTNTIEKTVKDLCKLKVPPDGLVFDPETVRGQRIREDADYEGVRVKFVGFLERSRVPMQIDVGFGDVIYPRPKMIDYPVMLDLPEPRLKGYPSETVVSEKFETIIKLGLLNSRMKDFYDLWLMMHQFNFNGSSLTEALKRTFKHRKTKLPGDLPLFAEEIYDEKSDRQVLWKAFLKKGDIQHAPEKLSAIAKEIEKFLIKPLNAINKGIEFKEEWTASKTWK